MRYKYNLIIQKKSELIKNIITKHIGYVLTDDHYKLLCNPNNRSSSIDNIICKYTSKYFINNNINNTNNLHRWNLNNRNKTKYESNYPW